MSSWTVIIYDMKLGVGVEWALHACLSLGWLGSGRAASTADLASFFGVPRAYLSKQLQALVRAGLVESACGRNGGFTLARPMSEISLLDVVAAIEGRAELFLCHQILANSPLGRPGVNYVEHCAISRAMRRADLAWRRQLADTMLSDLSRSVLDDFPHVSDCVAATLGDRPAARTTDPSTSTS